MILQNWLDANIKRLAMLVCLNGGRMEINGMVGPDAVRPAENRYGRVGLDVQEAFELTYLRGAFDVLVATSGDSEAIWREIHREIAGQQIAIATEEETRAILSGITAKITKRLLKGGL